MPWTLRMLLYITLLSLPVHLYIALKITRAVNELTGWPTKRLGLVATICLVWVLGYPILSLGSYWSKTGTFSQPFQQANLWLDLSVTYPFWIGLIVAVQTTIFLLPLDLVRVCLFFFDKKHRQRWRKPHAWIVIALVSIITCYAGFRAYTDTFTVRTRETVVEVADLPTSLEGFRLVHISDLQADGRTGSDKLQAYVDVVNRLNADLIVFGGDLVTSGRDYIETGAQTMGKMRAKFGIYACLGDHDFFSDPQAVRNHLEKNGVSVLDNIATVVPCGASFVSLTGLTNVYRTRPPDYALKTIEAQRPHGGLNILLVHQPTEEIIHHALANRYDLLAGGHTHGGQLVFQLPGLLLTPTMFETDYITGFYQIESLFISINNGLGLTLAPLRYQAPAEVTLIVLRARSAP